MSIKHKIEIGSVVFATTALSGKSVLARVLEINHDSNGDDWLICREIKSSYEKTFSIHISRVKAVEPKIITALRNALSGEDI